MQWSLTADGTIFHQATWLGWLNSWRAHIQEVKQNYESEPFVTAIRKQVSQKEAILSFNDKPIVHG